MSTINHAALPTARHMIRRDFGDCSDLPDELRNTIANLYYDYAANLVDPHPAGIPASVASMMESYDLKTAVHRHAENMAFALSAVQFLPDRVALYRLLPRPTPDQYDPLLILTLANFKYRDLNAGRKSSLRLAIERPIRALLKVRQIPGLWKLVCPNPSAPGSSSSSTGHAWDQSIDRITPGYHVARVLVLMHLDKAILTGQRERPPGSAKPDEAFRDIFASWACVFCVSAAVSARYVRPEDGATFANDLGGLLYGPDFRSSENVAYFFKHVNDREMLRCLVTLALLKRLDLEGGNYTKTLLPSSQLVLDEAALILREHVAGAFNDSANAESFRKERADLSRSRNG